MIKNTILFCFLVVFKLNAQDTLSGIIEYRHILNLNPAAPIDAEGVVAILYFDAFKSNYIYNQINLTKGDSTRTTKKETKSGMVRLVERDSIGCRVFKDLIKKKVVQRQISLKKAYIIEEELPEFKWEIKPEQKNLGSLLCQKAITRYRGRNYEAWFTMSVPVNTGPWKFNGLPGLILEVYDDTREVQFLFNKLSFTPLKDNELLEKSQQGLKTTWKEMEKLDQEEILARQKKIMSEAPKGITNVSFQVQKPKPIEYDE